MADVDRRHGGGGGGGGGGYRGGYQNNRKRRYRDDEDFDRNRNQRRRHDEPPHIKLRKQVLGLAESPLKTIDEELKDISRLIVDNYSDERLRDNFLDLTLQLVHEQPFKIPFVASIFLVSNNEKPILTEDIISRAARSLQEHTRLGAWREVKLTLRFFACMQGLLEGDGVFPLLQELFARAVDLQTASPDDGLGLELVKIIQLTIAYLMASSATGLEQQATTLLESTGIIASAPHPLLPLVDAYPGSKVVNDHEPQSMIGLLQKQLTTEAADGWALSCISRPWKFLLAQNPEDQGPKHTLPAMELPAQVISSVRPLLPEVYFSVYDNQELETVPPTNNIASTILRDALVDTINILHFNRNIAAKFLIDLDTFFAPDIFAKRGTPFDKLKELPEGSSTWKPEDVLVDAVFSQLLQLPTPEHKLVYFHSVLTEACKIAPAAIAPCLGRAIRYLYKNLGDMDLELQARFTDWFTHHLSNFGFTWKWTEWVDDVELSLAHPQKAFIAGVLEKEIRLSVVQRIRGTLPESYHRLLPASDEEESPPFKYEDDREPYAPQAREILKLIRSRAPEDEVQEQINAIEAAASERGVSDPSIPSTNVYTTCVVYAGSKSLSHILSYIERCKERLLAISAAGRSGQRQIVDSVIDYWTEKPGIAVNIVDKLLNYTILSPMAVIEWALVDRLERGKLLTKSYIYEMIASTTYKVSNRVRQIVAARSQPGMLPEQLKMLDDTLDKERASMAELFTVIEDALRGLAEGSADAMAESQDQDEEGETLLRAWGSRWLRVFRRKMAVEQAWTQEMLANPPQQEQEQEQNGTAGNREAADAEIE